MKLFVSIEQAKAWGLTHEGRLFGVPAWMRADGIVFQAVPKFTPLQLWALLCDWAFDTFARFMPPTATIESPIYLGRSIAEIEAGE